MKNGSKRPKPISSKPKGDGGGSSGNVELDPVVGFDCSSKHALDSFQDWHEYGKCCKGHFKKSLSGKIVSKDIKNGTHRPGFQMVPIRTRNGLERVVIKLYRADESRATSESVKDLCTVLANYIESIHKNRGVIRGDVKLMKIIAAWQGLSFLLLEAPSSVWNTLFQEFVWKGGWRMNLSPHVCLDAMAPAFALKGPFSSVVDCGHMKIYKEFADAVVWKEWGNTTTLLFPTSAEALNKLVKGRGMEYWRSENDDGWKHMPSISCEFQDSPRKDDQESKSSGDTPVTQASSLPPLDESIPERSLEEHPEKGGKARTRFKKSSGSKIFKSSLLCWSSNKSQDDDWTYKSSEHSSRASSSRAHTSLGDDSRVLGIEVRTWFSLKDEFPSRYHELFQLPVEERIRQEPAEIKEWLERMESAYEGVQQEAKKHPAPALSKGDMQDEKLKGYNPAREVEVLTWYALRDKFRTRHKRELFGQPASELLQKPPYHVAAWLYRVQEAWDGIQKKKERRAQLEAYARRPSTVSTSTMSSESKYSGVVGDNVIVNTVVYPATNPSVQNKKGSLDDSSSKYSMEKEMEVRHWYAVQQEFKVFDGRLFKLSADDMLQESPDELDVWLDHVQKAWDKQQSQSDRPAVSNGSDSEQEEDFRDLYGDDREHGGVINFGASKSAPMDVVPSRDLARVVGSAPTTFVPFDNTDGVDEEEKEEDTEAVLWNHGWEKEMEVRYWFEAHDELKVFDKQLLDLGPDERLQQSPEELNKWLCRVQKEWDMVNDGHRQLKLESFDDFDDPESEDDDSSDDAQFSTVNVVEVRTWFSLQDEFHVLDRDLFQLSEEEILMQHPRDIHSWLKRVQRAWNRYRAMQAKTQGSAHDSSSTTDKSKSNSSTASLSSSNQNVDDGEAAANERQGNDKKEESRMESEVHSWYALKDRFQVKYASALFDMTAQERLETHNTDEIKSWLRLVRKAWSRTLNVSYHKDFHIHVSKLR